MILLIDNYDSFSYNLVQLFGTLCLENRISLTPSRPGESAGSEAAGLEPDIRVIRNDAMTTEDIRNLHPDHIILSPGPGYPKDAGVCEDVVRQMKGEVPILGVCLGHQGICEVFGAEIVHAAKLMHGKQSTITIDNSDPKNRMAIDYDLVTLTRRYYRTGESEYYINGKNVRLKDISEMFMNTGIGRSGYSVIGQGKIAEIISQNSEERRIIFEEAAGIAKYKHKKRESERKFCTGYRYSIGTAGQGDAVGKRGCQSPRLSRFI